MDTIVYVITVEGRLSPDWTDWFECLEAAYDETTRCTVLRLLKDDPTLLHGVLAQIGALNLRLVSVEMVTG
jgi:hypothetical protein